MDISKLRQQLNELFDEMNDLKQSFMAREPMLNGGVYQTKTKCGNPNCKCMREGKLHIVWRYYHCENGKSKIKTLKKKDLSKYEKLTGRYIKFRNARIELIKLHKKMLKIIDRIEDITIEKGKQEL